MPNHQSPAELLTEGLIHEIRHPLMGIKLAVQLIENAMGAGLSRQAEWAVLLSQVARLDELLRSYQRFLSPGQAGPEVFELAPVLQQAIQLCRPRLQLLGSRFSYEPPPTGLYAYGTPDALTHAITNVIFNALDAIAEKGDTGRLCIRAMPSAKDAGRIEVRVSDEGGGIPPEILGKIFEPRFTTKPREKGSGLGLSIARRMMEAVGGEVALVEPADLFRQPWANTEFRISLWAQVPGQTVDVQAARQAAAAKAAPLFTVLLVEDDTVICMMLKRGLELSGYAVTAVGTAEEALELLEARRFDAVLTDKNLPGKSGEDVARAVRARSRDISLVMMTGYSSRESARTMQSLNADAYLIKPFEIAEVTKVLGQVIVRRKGQATVLARITLTPSAPSLHRVVLIEPDPNDRARLEGLLREQKLQPLVRTDVLAALDESPGPDALVVNSACVTPEIQQQLLQLQMIRPEFRVVLVSRTDTLSDSITAILLHATQMVQPWTDARATEELRRALDPRGVLG